MFGRSIENVKYVKSENKSSNFNSLLSAHKSDTKLANTHRLVSKF